MNIGDRLTEPSTGYKRIDGNDAIVKTYGTGFYSDLNATGYGYYNNTYNATNAASDYLEFIVFTTKLRIFVGFANTCNPAKTHDIYIDDTIMATESSYMNIAYGPTSGQRLLFEKINMTKKAYTIKIVNNATGYLVLDCIDIDTDAVLLLASPGKLKQSKLNLTSNASNGCQVTSSTQLSTERSPYIVFNGNNDTYPICYHSAKMTGRGFIKLKLTSKKN